jgi:hypothetical protein
MANILDYKIVYDKLSEAQNTVAPGNLIVIDNAEMEEIEELRKLVLEINDSQPFTYTST